MTCPECGGHAPVLDTRGYPDERRVWRRRECEDCGLRWTTDETVREGSESRPASRAASGTEEEDGD